MSLEGGRRRINRELAAGRIAERQVQRHYAGAPELAWTLVDPDNPRPGRFVPHPEENLVNVKRGRNEPPRRRRRA